jgi:serine/threonine protein kinase
MPDDALAGKTRIELLAAGRLIDRRYRLERFLGRGGMGVVWLARDETLNRSVALKFLGELLAGDRAAIDDLKQETTRCLELTHPRIVRIYDFVQDAGLAAISMEFVDGETLAALRGTKPHRCFAADDLMGWVEQLTDALHYAHCEARFVHRDLKPANLMIDRARQLKVSDFGIARSISESLTRITGSAEKISGTLGYMSPQQAQGWAPAPGDDIYAVGATLHELLAGKPPFYGPPALVFQQLMNVPAPDVNERRAEFSNGALPPVPAVWARAIAQCLAKDPAERPRDVREIAERLRQETATQMGVRRPVTTLVVAVQSRRKIVLLPLVAAGLLVVAGGAWLGWRQAEPAPAVPRRETPRASTPEPIPAVVVSPPPATPMPSTPVPATPTPVPTALPETPPVPAPMSTSAVIPAAPRAKTAAKPAPPTPKATARKTVREEPTPRPRANPIVRATPKPATPKPSGETPEERNKREIMQRAVERMRGPFR